MERDLSRPRPTASQMSFNDPGTICQGSQMLCIDILSSAGPTLAGSNGKSVPISCSHRVSKLQRCSPVSSFSESMDLGHGAIPDARQPLRQPSGQLCRARLNAFHHQPRITIQTVACKPFKRFKLYHTTWTLLTGQRNRQSFI